MRRLRESLVLVTLLGLGVATGGAGTWASWAAATESAGNSVATGTVALSGGGGSSVFVFTGISPGVQPKRCVLVTNAGTATVDVGLHGTISGQLKDHMTIKVTRGTQGGSCATPGTETTIYDGELNAFPTSTGSAITPAPAWQAGHRYPYLFELTLRNDPAAQGQTASVGMTWTAS